MRTPERDDAHIALLRRRAEEALQGQLVDLDGLQLEDIQALLHELQVHQVELHLQNEELHRVQQELETSRDRYADLYHFAPTGYCTLNHKGRILEANQTLADLLGVRLDQLVGSFLSQYVDRADQDAHYLHRQRTFSDHQRLVSEIRMVKPTGEKITVRMESVIAHGDSDQMRVALTDITQQQRMEKAIRESKAQQELQHRLLDQREQERQQIARDLHDGPVQVLIATTFAIRTLLMDESTREIAPQLETIQAGLQEQIHALRTYAGELRPPALAKFGLEKAIRSHAESFQEKHPELLIRLKMNQTGNLLPEATGLAIYRIYQHSLANILKHAQASEVRVQLEKDEQQAQLVIEDNGQGFELPEDWLDMVQSGHLGLLGMRERAEAVGGAMNIISQPGKGTRILISVPL